MKAGDVFQLVGVADKHFWVIISDPMIGPDHVLFVNFTTYDRFVDQTLVLTGDDHSSLSHRSCVNYPRARVASDAQLELLRSSNRIVVHPDPASRELLEKLRAGAVRSRMIRNEHLQILQQQGLLDSVE